MTPLLFRNLDVRPADPGRVQPSAAMLIRIERTADNLATRRDQ